MTLRQFRWIEAIMAVSIAVVLARTLVIHNFNLAILGVIVGALIIRISRDSVNEVRVDERDSEIAGKAANFSIRIFCALAIAVAFPLIYDGRTNHLYEIVGSTLAYAVVGLLIIYNIMLAFKKGNSSGWKRIGFIVLVAIFAFSAEILANWIFVK